MSSQPCILSLDQGTTSTRAVLYDRDIQPLAVEQRPLPQIFPASGWVEHDPEEIWDASLHVIRSVIKASGVRPDQVAALGITNQRETTVLWDRVTGNPLHNAIVWQDRRTAGLCEQIAQAGHGDLIREKTGLVVDAYFSASKIRWLLDHVPDLRSRAENGDVMFGTVDTFLLWRLSGGNVHATDATNAARTMLFDIHSQTWDDNLLEIWKIPRSLLPTVHDSNARLGLVDARHFGAEIPIAGMAGDQHAAMVGQACFSPGMTKCTYGTGAFLLLNTGEQPVESKQQMLTTLAYRVNGQAAYALEGSIFSAGSAIQWLRDGLGVLPEASSSSSIAAGMESNGGVYLVPAFTGLGAPYWDAGARGAIYGLTRDAGPANLIRAALESVAYQTLDVLRAMEVDGATAPVEIRVDGGMVANNWLCQFIADIVQCPVLRPLDSETTVRGAAILAGLGSGIVPDIESAARLWQSDRTFLPSMAASERESLYEGWLNAVERTTTRT